MFKIYTRFQTKTAQTPCPWGRHIPICLICTPWASAILVQCSTNWAIKPHGSWSRVCNIPIEGEMQIAMNIWKIIWYSHVIFCNSFLGVWKCGQIWSFVIDILYQTWDSQRQWFIGISKHRVKKLKIQRTTEYLSWNLRCLDSRWNNVWGVRYILSIETKAKEEAEKQSMLNKSGYSNPPSQL